MKLLPLLLLVALGFSSCAQYHKVVETDVRGNLIVSWVAQGPIIPRDGGYRFKAVQRNICDPEMEFHYPLGWKVNVSAPNFIIVPTKKPAWLYEPLTAECPRVEERVVVEEALSGSK